MKPNVPLNVSLNGSTTPPFEMNIYVLECCKFQDLNYLDSVFTFSFGSLALLLTRPYISCSEAPTGLRSLLCLPGSLCLWSEVSGVTPGSPGDDADGDEVRPGLTAPVPAPVRLAPGTQGSGLGSDSASLNLRSLRPTPASCIISPGQPPCPGLRGTKSTSSDIIDFTHRPHPSSDCLHPREETFKHSDVTAGYCNNSHFKSSGMLEIRLKIIFCSESCDTSSRSE